MQVDQLNSFASEVTRVAREVGTEGKLGEQAHVKGVGGVWKDLTDSTNPPAVWRVVLCVFVYAEMRVRTVWLLCMVLGHVRKLIT